MESSTHTRITGLLLAGGLGRRMGGVDKGLQEFKGRPMAAWVLERLTPQVDEMIINANQNTASYERFGHAVIGDHIAGYVGPLAGLHAGLGACATPLLVTSPCDSPFLPTDLVARLRAGLEAEQAMVAVARAGGRLQPVFALVRREACGSLERYLAEGGRKVEAWFATLHTAIVDFPDEAAFANINTREELATMSRPSE